MDGHSVARTLTRTAERARRSTDAFSFRVSTADDIADINTLLRESGMPGRISLGFERQPDSRIAGRVEGPVHHGIVARSRATGQLAAIASRSVRQRFVEGQPARVGYLSQLRVHPAFRRVPSLMDDGFAFCRSLHEQEPCALYLASVVGENTAARRLLERGRRGWPKFSPVDEIVTLIVPTRGRIGETDNVRIVAGTEVGAAELAACLWRYNANHQFAPCWTAEDLTSAHFPDLSLSDFMVAVAGGSIVGCAALWDQRAFKQIVVRDYAPGFRRVRPLLNAIAPIAGIPSLPAPGEQVRLAFVSHLAVAMNDGAVTVQLLGEAVRRARRAGLDYVAVGLSARSPVLARLRRAFRHRSYNTVLYGARWPEQSGDPLGLDGRPAQPEIAIL